MKLEIQSSIDLGDIIDSLDRKDALDLILEIDQKFAEEDFTFSAIQALVKSLIEYDGLTKEYIIENIFKN